MFHQRLSINLWSSSTYDDFVVVLVLVVDVLVAVVVVVAIVVIFVACSRCFKEATFKVSSKSGQ